MSLFTIYSSSAGSGKTFTLTKEYLKLVLRSENPLYFQKILAMTFTNDAAEEMKSRILKGLAILQEDAAEKPVMLSILEKELPELDEEEIRKRAGLIHHEILQNYNDFSVKTIDSFVNQVVSAFTIDLNLPYNYEIVLDTTELISEAVRNLIDRVGDDEELTAIFKDFALDKLDENKSWNTLEADIVNFGTVIYRDNNAEEIEKNLEITHADVIQIRKKIKAYLKDTEENIQNFAKKALELIDSNGLGETDFTRGLNGIYGFFKKLSEDPKVLYTVKTMPNTYVKDALEKDKWYTKTAAAATKTAIDSIKDELRNFGIRIIESKTEKYGILSIVNRNLLKIPFLAIIKKEVNKILEERNEVVLADFNQKILNVVSKEPVPYIYERIGEKYNHLLVDEFQDTSDIQFFNLLPLFENAISKNQENLIVGDPKQAIYSWRGGNVMLMLDLISKEGSYLNQKTPEIQQWQISTILNSTHLKNLSTNYRSHEEIIRFNNQLFTSMLSRQDNAVAKLVFSDYIQESPENPKKGGYTAVEILSKEETDFSGKLSELITGILTDGYSLSDIAILCRKRREGEEIAEILKTAGYEINSTEVLKLQNNKAVRFLVSGLRYINRPERQFERFEFLQFFFLVKGIDQSLYDIQEICSLPLSEYTDYFKKFGISLDGTDGLPPYQLLEFLCDRFSLFSDTSSADYLLAFLDFALDFTNRKSKSIGEFLTIWEIRKDKLSIAAQSDNAITISTIHKAKGLEYPVVIMPYVSWKTTPNNDASLWLGLEKLEYPELQSETASIRSAPFGYSGDFSFSKEIIEREKNLILIENLNMLYVALTRPVERQYLWIWEKVSRSSVSVEGIGSIIKDFLSETEDFHPAKKLYEFGQKQLKKHNKTISTPENDELPFSFPNTFTDGKQLRLNPIVQAAEEKIQTGNLIHLAFEKIRKENDVDSVLQSMIASGDLSEENLQAIREKIVSVIHHPDLIHLFQPNAVVKNEVEILSSHTQVKRPDRVIFINNKVYVLDYKTGKKSASHARQLKGYAGLLRQMGYADITLLIAYLDPLEVVKV